MVVTATELKQNLSKYIELSNNEEVVVTKNGRPVTYLNGPTRKKQSAFEHFAGSLAWYRPTTEELEADPRLKRILSR